MSHVVLLGDSIFDNGRYVPGSPAVVEQLRLQLPRGWRATLAAVDGSTAEDVARQLAKVPADASHLFVSAGGNDALEASSLLDDPDRPSGEVLAELPDIQARFRHSYAEVLRAVLSLGKPTAVCTVYDAVPGLPAEATTLLSVFNDVILREAFRAGLPVLDLRQVCAEARDYAATSPIEPSKHGGFKIAQAIARVVTAHESSIARTVVYGYH